MLSIQQAGSEILGNQPRNLYFFCGKEYGVKKKYIEHLSTLYSSVVSVDGLGDLFRSFNRKSLVASKSCLYVCRYDDSFVRSIASSSDTLASKINSTDCVVAVFDDDKSFKKLDKVFPENVVRFDTISTEFVCRYLRKDFPELDDRYIHLVAPRCLGGYGQAYIVCSQMNSIRTHLHAIEDSDLLKMFGLESSMTEDQMMKYAAARNILGVLSVVDSFEGDINHLINGMCHVAIELDKAMDSKSSTDYSKYVKYWTREDVYNFFEQAYTQTLKLRSSVGGEAYNCLVYLASLLAFKRIPSVEQVG